MRSASFPSRPDIEADQIVQLNRLVAALVPDNPFYADKLRGAGIGVGLSSLEQFVRRMPFTTKEQIVEDQQAHPPIGTNLTYPIRRYTRFSQTSATTGSPMRWLDDSEGWAWMLGNWTHVYAAAGVGIGDRIFFAFSFGPFLGFWTAFEAATQLGCLCIPGGAMSSAARLQVILDNAVTVLCCTPTYAIRLGEIANDGGIDLAQAKVKVIIVAGEGGGSVPATRRHIQRLWPTAHVFDHHGMTEVGPVSFQCPKRAGVLHVIETSYLAEVIDPATGGSARPGDTGELVLTTLGRHGSPLLRYRTGDLVRPTTSVMCECGRSEMALEGGILARVDDMVLVRGVNLYPSAVDEVVRSIPGIAEYRVEIRSERAMAELTITIEAENNSTDAAELCDKLQGALHAAFNLRIVVKTAASGALPRFEMKAKRWVRQ